MKDLNDLREAWSAVDGTAPKALSSRHPLIDAQMNPPTSLRTDAEKTLPRTVTAEHATQAPRSVALEAAHVAVLNTSLAVAGRTAARFLGLKD
jgi:hypothetical protein